MNTIGTMDETYTLYMDDQIYLSGDKYYLGLEIFKKLLSLFNITKFDIITSDYNFPDSNVFRINSKLNFYDSNQKLILINKNISIEGMVNEFNRITSKFLNYNISELYISKHHNLINYNF